MSLQCDSGKCKQDRWLNDFTFKWEIQAHHTHTHPQYKIKTYTKKTKRGQIYLSNHNQKSRILLAFWNEDLVINNIEDVGFISQVFSKLDDK